MKLYFSGRNLICALELNFDIASLKINVTFEPIPNNHSGKDTIKE